MDQREPTLTSKRYVGMLCEKCGTHVRRKSDDYCISCAQTPTATIRESKRLWHRRNFAQSKAIKKAWLKQNPGAVAKRNIQYKSSIRSQTPAWANLPAINSIYLEAQELGLTVDHIYPLHGMDVCGLHVETNLRLLTHSENARKKNRHPEEVE